MTIGLCFLARGAWFLLALLLHRAFGLFLPVQEGAVAQWFVWALGAVSVEYALGYVELPAILTRLEVGLALAVATCVLFTAKDPGGGTIGAKVGVVRVASPLLGISFFFIVVNALSRTESAGRVPGGWIRLLGQSGDLLLFALSRARDRAHERAQRCHGARRPAGASSGVRDRAHSRRGRLWLGVLHARRTKVHPLSGTRRGVRSGQPAVGRWRGHWMSGVTGDGRMRIALVGCGIIATSHARAIASTEAAQCTALLDVLPSRARVLQRTLFPHAEVVAAVGDIASRADAAIVATPAGSHAALSIDLLRAGLHVLCEKPLATTLEDARAMVAAADSASRVLVCGLVRRFLVTTGLVREALENHLVGEPRRADVWESVTDWPMPKHSFDRLQSGGGAFFDVAPHVLDLLGLWFGKVEVSAYRDDAVGGVESVARAEVSCRGPYGSVPATVHLSRGFQASNRCRIVCTRGTIEINVREPDAIRLTFGPSGRGHLLKASAPVSEPFALQLEDFVRAASGLKAAHASSAAALETVALVEECYRVRQPLPTVYAEEVVSGDGSAMPYRKILLTGANGHIGTRLVEMWAARGELPRLRCLLRSYRNAAPILRYPAEIVEGDLLDRDALSSAAQGCDAIVHLAVGSRAAQEVENLTHVAKALGIRRFVHMSSAAVYGRDMPSSIERLQEETPTRKLGEAYADAKTFAERAALRASPELDLVILRPHIVYGPAQRWGILMVDLLRRGVLAAVEDSGWCNLIYVDDLVRAVDCALLTTDGVGQAFFVTDGKSPGGGPMSFRPTRV